MKEIEPSCMVTENAIRRELSAGRLHAIYSGTRPYIDRDEVLKLFSPATVKEEHVDSSKSLKVILEEIVTQLNKIDETLQELSKRVG